MFKLYPVLLSALLIVGLSGIDGASAQGSLPGGSYTQTCDVLLYSAGKLQANCRTRNQDSITTELNVRQCAYPVIENLDGRLSCQARDGRTLSGTFVSAGPAVRYNPPGSYAKTCKVTAFDGAYLQATCQTADGSWVRSELDYSQCGGGATVTNDDGVLICDR